MDNEIEKTVSELKEISDSFYKGFKLVSTFLEDVQLSGKVKSIPKNSLETYVKGFLTDVVLKKIFGEYLK